MPATFKLDRKELLVFAALLEGCGYYGCKDDLKRGYVPEEGSSRWRGARTLELHFGGALRAPDEVDPRRFALLRYNADFARSNEYYCYFDVCYRGLKEAAEIPESLGWDPAEPEVLRLHFAEPIPASSCEPWPGNRADFQALELIYLGVPGQPFGETGEAGETGETLADAELLAYADDRPVEELGPEQALEWLEGCFVGEPASSTSSASTAGGSKGRCARTSCGSIAREVLAPAPNGSNLELVEPGRRSSPSPSPAREDRRQRDPNALPVRAGLATRVCSRPTDSPLS